MRCLIIDDDEAKYSAVHSVVAAVLPSSPFDVQRADNLSEAMRLLSASTYDLIILDLMLPYIQEAEASSRAGLELLRQLRRSDSPNRLSRIVGLSAFPAEILEYRHEFNEFGVVITCFDEEGHWARTVARVASEVAESTVRPRQFDFLIFVALDEERDGFRDGSLELGSERIISGLIVQEARLPGRTETFGAVVRLRQMGLVSATFEVTLALAIFDAPIVCMSGICAGFPKRVHIGQLIVASPAWEYQAGKWSENDFEIAPVQMPLRPETRAIVDRALREEEFLLNLEHKLNPGWKRPIDRSSPMLAPVATGSAVIADAARIAHIEKQHRKVAALDMETFGLYYAAHESSSSPTHFFSAKCVVDYADGAKGDDFHAYGAVVAARTTVHLIEALLAAGDCRENPLQSRVGRAPLPPPAERLTAPPGMADG